MAVSASPATGDKLDKPRVGLRDLSLKKIMYAIRSL